MVKIFADFRENADIKNLMDQFIVFLKDDQLRKVTFFPFPIKNCSDLLLTFPFDILDISPQTSSFLTQNASIMYPVYDQLSKIKRICAIECNSFLIKIELPRPQKNFRIMSVTSLTCDFQRRLWWFVDGVSGGCGGGWVNQD